MALNTHDISCLVSNRTGVSREDTQKVLDGFFKEVVDIVRNGDEVALRGFGVFRPIVRPARTITDVTTGKRIRTEESRSFYFRVSRNHKRL